MLRVEAPVKPSEDEERVRRAMLNIFPDLEIVRVEEGPGGGMTEPPASGGCEDRSSGPGAEGAEKDRGPAREPRKPTGGREVRLVGRGESLSRFAELLRRQKIRDAARRVLLKGVRGDGAMVFRLNKQAAFVGKVSFSGGESPLGDISVLVEQPGIVELIDGIAPDTRRVLPEGRAARAGGGGKERWREGLRRRQGGPGWDWREELREPGEEE